MPYPQEITWAKFRVTAVVICAIAILSVLVYLLTGGGLLEPKTRLLLYVGDATGVGKGSPVRVNGIGVGKVDKVELTGSQDPNRVVRIVLKVDVERLRSIPVDSTAQLSADTLIGDRFVDISSGRQHAFIFPGAEIAYQPPSDLMKKLDITQFEQQLRKIDALLRDIEQGKTRVGEFIVGEGMYSDLLRRLAELQAGIRRASATTGQVGALLYSDTLYEQVSRPLQELDQSIARIQSGQGTAGQLLRDAGDYERMREAAADLRRSLADLRSGRGAGAALLTSDAAWENLSRSIVSLMNAVDRVNAGPLFRTSDVYDNLNGFSREIRDTVRDFRRDPQKYMRIKVF